MKDVSRFDVTLSYVALLLEEQRYEEALPILGTLMDMNPSDREARMYRLLVLRILVQRYYLSNPVTDSTRQPHLIAKKLLATLAAESAERLRSFGGLCRAMQPLAAKALTNRLTIAAAACAVLGAPLVFYMAGGHTAIQNRPQVAFIDAANLVVSAVDLKGHLARAATATELNPATDEWHISLVMSEPGDSKLPVVSWTETVPPEGITRVEPLGLRTKVAKPARRLETRLAAAGRQDPVSSTTIHKKKTATKETIVNKPRKDSSAQYQSKRTLSIRESASFAAGVVQEIASGTLVSVLEFRGSWAKIEVGDRGITGFIRKEFLMPVNLGRAIQS